MAEPVANGISLPDQPIDSDPGGGGGSGGGSGGSYSPPIITTASLPSGSIGAPYAQTVQAAYGTTPYTWSITGSLPPGLAFLNASISGTPTQSGLFSFAVSLTDAAGNSASANLSVNIPSSPSITNSSLPDGTVGTPYTAALTGTGGAAPYTYKITGGALPSGLTLASTGGINGTPTTAGSFAFTVRITDSVSPGAGTGTKDFTITIQNAGLAASVRSLEDCVLLGCADGAIYATIHGMRHDEDYNGDPVAIHQRWKGVRTSGGKLALNQLGGATVGAIGNGDLKVSIFADDGTEKVLSTEQRPMRLSLTETTRDFMAKAVPKSARFGPCLDNGAVIDSWFEAHVFIQWMRAFFSGRKG